MNVIIIGLGNQGKKRLNIAGTDVVATVDPHVKDATHTSVADVDPATYDAAIIATPDQVKISMITRLLSLKKHVLVEKPLLAKRTTELNGLIALSKKHGVVCYTAYNHRFEPHIKGVQQHIKNGAIGTVYTVRLFYGNGTAQHVRGTWRDLGFGVLQDLGTHLLDIADFLLGRHAVNRTYQRMIASSFETIRWDHILFGSEGGMNNALGTMPDITLEATYLSWKNTFSMDILGEKGSLHVNGLCKWGPSTLTIRSRVLPSGPPMEQSETIESEDPTWKAEYNYFKAICKHPRTSKHLWNDIWINEVIHELGT